VRAVLAFLLTSPLLPAQDRDVYHNAHGWYSYFGDHPIGDSKWRLHVEGQWRRHDVITRWQQLLLRPGVNFAVNPNLVLSGGYAYVLSYPYGDPPASRARTPEHRLWEQALIRYRAGNLPWSTRLRFENRFLGVLAAGSNRVERFRYENRLRAMQRVNVPLSDKTYLGLSDELWFFIPPYQSRSRFDQNRAYAAVGRRFGPNWDVEIGYLHQLIRLRSGLAWESNHTLIVSLISRHPFRRSRD
jgi:hypothetical protein